jgi:hypothetical protein
MKDEGDAIENGVPGKVVKGLIKEDIRVEGVVDIFW